MKKVKREILLYGASRIDSDILYFTEAFVPDPFFAFTLNGEKCAILNALELGRVGKSASIDRIFDATKAAKVLSLKLKRQPDECDIAIAILKSAGVKALVVPRNFPVLYANKLFAGGFDIEICDGEIFPKRAVKTSAQQNAIKAANAVAARGFMTVETILRQSEILGGKVVWRNVVLTSQMLIAEIEKAAIEGCADALDTIAASGVQACDPHERGHGEIAANSLIVVDIFPRMRDSGYFGDMTRTFMKGRPTSAQEKLVQSVAQAQKIAIDKLSDGANGKNIHNSVEEFFSENGYKTFEKNGSWRGFFHSTGHGVGLDIHESPSISRRECILRKGNVVTVEPGLYYPEIGACRIEDTMLVTKDGSKYLSEYGYNWVIS